MAKKQIQEEVPTESDVDFSKIRAVGSEEGEEKEIRIAVCGLGNCASALLQGVQYYKDIQEEDMYINGLMNPSVGGYLPRHIKIVAAFDVNTLKIGHDVAEAIYADPITTPHIVDLANYPPTGVIVQPGPILDGVADHMRDQFHVYDENEMQPVDVAQVLRDTHAQIVLDYCPVGSFQAARFYAQAALDAGCGFINCIPEFIVSEHIPGDKDWVQDFIDHGLPCAGDDIKSQVGATIMHRMLSKIIP